MKKKRMKKKKKKLNFFQFMIWKRIWHSHNCYRFFSPTSKLNLVFPTTHKKKYIYLIAHLFFCRWEIISKLYKYDMTENFLGKLNPIATHVDQRSIISLIWLSWMDKTLSILIYAIMLNVNNQHSLVRLRT